MKDFLGDLAPGFVLLHVIIIGLFLLALLVRGCEGLSDDIAAHHKQHACDGVK